MNIYFKSFAKSKRCFENKAGSHHKNLRIFTVHLILPSYIVVARCGLPLHQSSSAECCYSYIKQKGASYTTYSLICMRSNLCIKKKKNLFFIRVWHTIKVLGSLKKIPCFCCCCCFDLLLHFKFFAVIMHTLTDELWILHVRSIPEHGKYRDCNFMLLFIFRGLFK